jgi:hypothetical protein
MESTASIQSWIGIGVAALTLAVPLAEASGEVVAPISQDRSTAVEVRNYHYTCPFAEYLPGGICDIPITIITDETLNDGQIASDFGPFSANTSVPVEGTNSWATQESAIHGASLAASGVFFADGLERLYPDLETDWDVHQQYIDPQVETRFSVTFSLDEAIPFYLRGDLELEGGPYCDPEFPNPAQASLTLTGPGGVIVDSAISVDVGNCSPRLALRETGQLAPGVYTLEVMAGGEGSGMCSGFIGPECWGVPTSGEFWLQFGLGPQPGPVPALPSGAIALLAALLATLGATSLFPRK